MVTAMHRVMWHIPSKRSKSGRSSGSLGSTSEKSSWFSSRSLGMSDISLAMSSGSSSALSSGVDGLLREQTLTSVQRYSMQLNICDKEKSPQRTTQQLYKRSGLGTWRGHGEWAVWASRALPGCPAAQPEEWASEVSVGLAASSSCVSWSARAVWSSCADGAAADCVWYRPRAGNYPVTPTFT